ncbi:MAG TPA: hypothetical protein VK524_06670, partial [Polyangiaceae bacterium]|nr:hypothetical protein [Polyangiaceae bacterium]
MSELDSQCLMAFPEWLQRLPADSRAFADVLQQADAPRPVRAEAAAALNHLVKSLDLVPQSIEELGFIETAFVLRAAAARMLQDSADASDSTQSADRDTQTSDPASVFSALAEEASLLEPFLGADFPRFTRYMGSLGELVVRGRSVPALLNDVDPRSELCDMVTSWAASYRAPRFVSDAKSLVKIRAFL